MSADKMTAHFRGTHELQDATASVVRAGPKPPTANPVTILERATWGVKPSAKSNPPHSQPTQPPQPSSSSGHAPQTHATQTVVSQRSTLRLPPPPPVPEVQPTLISQRRTQPLPPATPSSSLPRAASPPPIVRAEYDERRLRPTGASASQPLVSASTGSDMVAPTLSLPLGRDTPQPQPSQMVLLVNAWARCIKEGGPMPISTSTTSHAVDALENPETAQTPESRKRKRSDAAPLRVVRSGSSSRPREQSRTPRRTGELQSSAVLTPRGTRSPSPQSRPLSPLPAAQSQSTLPVRSVSKRPRTPSPFGTPNKRPRAEGAQSFNLMSRMIAMFSPFKQGAASPAPFSPRPIEHPRLPIRAPVAAPLLPGEYLPAPAELCDTVFYRSGPLNRCNLKIHQEEKLLICSKCEHAVVKAYEHYRDTHDGKLTQQEKKLLEDELDTKEWCRSPADVRVRVFGEPYIEGIKYSVGYSCDTCGWASASKKVAETHCNQHHGHNKSFIQQSHIQSVFTPGWTEAMRWVRVTTDRTIPVGNGESAVEVYRRTWAVKLIRDPVEIPGPRDDNDIPLLARETSYLVHLRDYIKTKPDVSALRALTDTKHALTHDEPFMLLQDVVAEWIKQAAGVVRMAELDVAYLLQTYPRGDATKTFRIPTNETVHRYSQILLKLFSAMRATVQADETAYQLPFTNDEKTDLIDFQKALGTQYRGGDPLVAQLVPRFHDFIKQILMKREGRPELKNTKFASILECFMALMAIQEGGNLCRADQLTIVPTSLKFIIRICVAFEANKIAQEEDSPPLDEIVEELAAVHLNKAVKSEFSRVSTNASLLAGIVSRSTGPSHVHFSPDYQFFTCNTTTVYLPALRLGVRNLLDALKDRFRALQMGVNVEFKNPGFWVDDWENFQTGDTFLRHNRFFPAGTDDPWRDGLLKSTTLAETYEDGITPRCDALGDLLFNSQVVNTILERDEEFLQLLNVAVFLLASGNRGAEQVEDRLSNGVKSRGLLVEFDGEPILFPGRAKPEPNTRRQDFNPGFLPPELGAILLYYVIVNRPFINNLVRIHTGDNHAAVYQAEYLWATRGKVPTGHEFGDLLRATTKKYFGVEITLNSWRQITTEALRQYSPHPLPSDDDVGDVHDIRMNHSKATARAHYGSRDRYMSGDLLNRFRAAYHDLHQLLGTGPRGHVPMIPVRMRESHAPNCTSVQTPSTQGIGGVSEPEFWGKMDTKLAESHAKNNPTLVNLLIGKITRLTFGQGQPPPPPQFVRPPFTPGTSARVLAEITPPPSQEPPPKHLAELRAMLGPKAKFRSIKQEQAVGMALDGKVPFLALLGPGEGKSLIFQLPAFHYEGLNLVILPRKVLVADQLRRAAELRIPSHHWTASHEHVPAGTRLIFVELSSMQSAAFDRLLTNPDLRRVVVDEVHEFLAAWRRAWGDLVKLTEKRVQVIAFSGSVAFGSENKLIDMMGFRINVSCIRSEVYQPIHQFVHLRLGAKQTMPRFIESLTDHLTENVMEVNDQGIVFYASKNTVHELAIDPKICASTSGLATRDNDAVAWLAGRDGCKFLHATTTCILGIDNSRCNVVVFVDFFPSLVDILQGSARGGRRGQPTLVIFVSSHRKTYAAGAPLDDDPQCKSLGADMLNGQTECFRTFFGTAFNGRPHTCSDIPKSLKCQRCAPSTRLFCELQTLVTSRRPQPGVSSHSNLPALPPQVASTSLAVPARPQGRAVTYNPAVPSGEDDIVIQALLREAEHEAFVKKLRKIAAISKLLAGCCGACWLLTGALNTCDHGLFRACQLGRRQPTNATADDEFRAWKIDFEEHRSCYNCYMPQVTTSLNQQNIYNSLYTTHPIPGRGQCTHPQLFKILAWTVFKTPNIWKKFRRDFGERYPANPSSSTEYAKWLATETDGLVNMGHLAAWVQDYRTSRDEKKARAARE
ncbi:hypothetical protein FB45DRAFT_1038979 [Roridomyces roridus]|uniref:DNA 3'-5' helicase n=1 Tax=Roridomyces roridus TaxID=1738132 RepID=A0AAD7B4K0_9AGAR|nr:hypothetical protein FB45DRAFT_1038979 [Roridomyces roridus]